MSAEIVIVVVGVAGIFASTVALVVLTPVLYAWAIVTLWGWFLTAYAPVPPIAAVYGALLVLALTRRHADERTKTSKEAWTGIASAVAKPLVIVAFAWILKRWL